MMTPKELGKLFKDKRETLGMSRKDAYERSRLHPNVISDIEDGIHDRLGKLYVKSFIKKYAVFLGMDVEDITKKFDSIGKASLTPVFSRVSPARKESAAPAFNTTVKTDVIRSAPPKTGSDEIAPGMIAKQFLFNDGTLPKKEIVQPVGTDNEPDTKVAARNSDRSGFLFSGSKSVIKDIAPKPAVQRSRPSRPISSYIPRVDIGAYLGTFWSGLTKIFLSAWRVVSGLRIRVDKKIVFMVAAFALTVVLAAALVKVIGKIVRERPAKGMLPVKSAERVPQTWAERSAYTEKTTPRSLEKENAKETAVLTPQPSAKKSAPFSLTLRAKGPVWVKIFEDGETVYVGTLNKGDERVFKASGILTIWTGKGENLYFTIDRRDVGKVANGVVRDIKVSKEGVIVDNEWVKRL